MRNRKQEKPKDLVGTWKKLLGYCRKYLVILVIALVCAAAGTVCTLVGPDKLSDMTDAVTSGISPDTDKLQEISTVMSENIAANMQTVITEIAGNLSDTENMQMELEVNGQVISFEDQRMTMEIFASLDGADDTQKSEAVQKLPDAVKKALYTDITVDKTVITGAEQLEMTNLMAEAGDDADSMLAVFDKLPDSVYQLIKPAIDMDKVFHIGIVLVILYACSYVLSAIQGIIMATITQKVSKQMRSDISEKINCLPMWFYNRTTTGDVLSRVTNDVDTIGQSLNQSIGNLISALILFAGSFIMMLVTDRWMTLTAVGASLIGFIIMFVIMGKSQKYFRRQQKHLGEINGHIEEIYTGHTVVKAYNGEHNAQKIFDEMNTNLQESGFRAQCLSGMMMPVMSFIGNLGYVAVCVVGGAMALNGKISFGVIVAFMMYVRYFTQPLAQIAQAVQTMQSAAAAGERVFDFLEAEEMENEDGKIENLSLIHISEPTRH